MLKASYIKISFDFESIIAHVLPSLIAKINSNCSTVLVLFGLKKAFDLINHKLLLGKLSV